MVVHQVGETDGGVDQDGEEPDDAVDALRQAEHRAEDPAPSDRRWKWTVYIVFPNSIKY